MDLTRALLGAISWVVSALVGWYNMVLLYGWVWWYLLAGLFVGLDF